MIILKINTIDKSDFINWVSLSVTQNLTNLVDVASFTVRKFGDKTLEPVYNDDIEISDGTTKIFSGKILKVSESVEASQGVVYSVSCVDHTYEFDKLLVGKTYKNKTISEIIADIITNYTPAGSGFTSNNATSTFLINKIVFNQIRPSDCLTRLADLLKYDWYIDEDKDVHFFSKETNSAPYNLTDTSGNFVYKSLKRNIDGSQLVNKVKVRGGEYDGDTYTDSITVSGDISKSFKLPYKMSNLTVKLNTVVQTVGVDFIDDFTSSDVLHNYQSQSFRFENVLTDGDVIEFSGNPKIRVFAVAQNAGSVSDYGVIEKLIRENDISSNEVARQRAQAELLAYSEKLIDAKFLTYDSGLRVGMNINVSSDKRGSYDSFLIKSLNFSTIDPNTFIYKVNCVSTKTIDFIQLLQKIIKAEPLDIDETETSEEIFSINEEVNIEENIEVINPYDVDEEVGITENLLIDPVDPDDVVFVLAPYVPTSQFDTKRDGRLDISMQVYDENPQGIGTWAIGTTFIIYDENPQGIGTWAIGTTFIIN